MEQIFYLAQDATGQSQLAAALAKIKYPNATVTATDGKNNTAMVACIDALTDDTHDDICICMPLVDSHAAGKFTVAQAILLIAKLKVAKQGINEEGTARSNSTKTNIVLAASGPSATVDYYNGRIIATAGVTAIERLITDYNGSTTKVCTVADTGTAITTTETYTVYMTDHLHLIGELNYAGASEAACYTAFKNLFPSAKQIPTLVNLMYSTTLYHKDTVTASGSCAAATIVDSGEFTAAAYDGLDYWAILETATTGGGQIRKILSNTTGALTMEKAWSPLPTGTPVYSVKEGANRLGWDLYIKKAIPVYFRNNTSECWSLFKRMIDQYGDLYDGKAYGYEEESLIEEYIEKGKCICEALWAGTVS